MQSTTKVALSPPWTPNALHSTLSQMGKRSLNNEILLLLERSVQEETNYHTEQKKNISKETQINMWKKSQTRSK